MLTGHFCSASLTFIAGHYTLLQDLPQDWYQTNRSISLGVLIVVLTRCSQHHYCGLLPDVWEVAYV